MVFPLSVAIFLKKFFGHWVSHYKVSIGVMFHLCGKSTCNILLWWYTPCFFDGDGGGGDKCVTLLVTLLGAAMVDVFIFTVDVGDWRHCSHNSAMVLFSQLGCSLCLLSEAMGSLIQLIHVALCNCISSDCGNISNTFPEVVNFIRNIF